MFFRWLAVLSLCTLLFLFVSWNSALSPQTRRMSFNLPYLHGDPLPLTFSLSQAFPFSFLCSLSSLPITFFTPHSSCIIKRDLISQCSWIVSVLSLVRERDHSVWNQWVIDSSGEIPVCCVSHPSCVCHCPCLLLPLLFFPFYLQHRQQHVSHLW